MAQVNAPPQTPDPEVMESLCRSGLLNEREEASFEALSGGVSSDIWKVETGNRIFCVKKALPKLQVEADWFAPVERNRYEAAWCEVVGKLVPGSAPRILAHDEDAMFCAMDYLASDTHKLWKDELRDGRADPGQAAEVGRRLGLIHAGTAGDETIEAKFPRTDIFYAIRLEPYLEASAAAHPDLRDRLFALSERTGNIQYVMIHGDVSPKNVLIGPDGPVFLDAECACMGDPAFDLAFCLNHFLLKCLWTPAVTRAFLDCFEAMTSSYLAEVTWESAEKVEARAASLLPGLFIARVDGKSPAEYITDEVDKDKIRNCVRPLLASPPVRLAEVLDAWRDQLSK